MQRADVDAVGHRLLAVDFELQHGPVVQSLQTHLRHRGFRRVRLRQHFVHRIHESLVPDPAAVLHLVFETRGVPEFGDRRKIHGNDHAVGIVAEVLNDAPGDRFGGLIRPRALAPVRQADERQPDVLPAPVEREALNRHRRIDFRQRKRIFLVFLDQFDRALLRGRRRELEQRDDVALVFVWKERRGQPEIDPGEAGENGGETDETDRGTANQPRDDALVAARHLLESAVEHSGEPALLSARIMLEHRRAQRRRQRQRQEKRERHGSDQRQRKLPINDADGTGEKRHRDEHGRQHQRDADESAGNLPHRLARRVARRKPLLRHDALDVFDDDDRVVDENPDREHHPEHRQNVDREAHHVERGASAEQRDRDDDRRDERRPQILQKHEHDDEDEHDRLHQRLDHFVNRNADEQRRIVRKVIRQAFREILRKLLHLRLDERGDVQRVRARCELDAQTGSREPVVARLEGVGFAADLDARHVLEVDARAVLGSAQENVLEFRRRFERPRPLNRHADFGSRKRGSTVDFPRGNLNVLLLQGGNDVRRRHPVGIELVRIEPNTHRVFRTEELHLTDAVDALNLVENVRRDVVPDFVLRHRAVAGIHADDERHVARRLLHGDARLLNGRGKHRRRE